MGARFAELRNLLIYCRGPELIGWTIGYATLHLVGISAGNASRLCAPEPGLIPKGQSMATF